MPPTLLESGWKNFLNQKQKNVHSDSTRYVQHEEGNGFQILAAEQAQGRLAWICKEGREKKENKKITLEAFGLSGKLDPLGIVFLIQSSHFYLIFLVTWW